jgi:drug/metabolite transporter (DMT)-like permease
LIKYILIPLGIAASATAQIFLKKASYLSHEKNLFYVYFFLAGLSYVVSFGLYTIILKYFPITKISPVMTLGTMAVITVIGIILFHEIISVKQMIGLTFGIIAIILIIF